MKSNIKRMVVGVAALALVAFTVDAASFGGLTSAGQTVRVVDSAAGVGNSFGVGTTAYAGTNGSQNLTNILWQGVTLTNNAFANVVNYTGVCVQVSWQLGVNTNATSGHTNLHVWIGPSVDGVHPLPESAYMWHLTGTDKQLATSGLPNVYGTNVNTMGFPYYGVWKMYLGHTAGSSDYYQFASNIIVTVAPNGPLH